MARLQIVQLPAAPDNPAPYLIVIDDLDDEQADHITDTVPDMTTIKGCAGALVWRGGRMAVPAPLPAPRWTFPAALEGAPKDGV